MACPDCFRGAVQEGSPRGEIKRIHGLDTYVSEPLHGRPAKGVIVIIPDAFGMPFVNNQLLADRYAENGSYRVYLPDFMSGYPAPAWMLDTVRVLDRPGNYLAKLYNIPLLIYAIVPWYYYNRIGASYPRVRSFFTALRSDAATSTLSLFVAGFCWGGKHALLLAAEPTCIGDGERAGEEQTPLVDAGFTGHPSLLTIPRDVERIRRPVAFAVGDGDSYLSSGDIGRIKRIVEGFPEEYKGEVRVYGGCGHGFCVRADTRFEDSQIISQAQRAEEQCLDWFERFLVVRRHDS